MSSLSSRIEVDDECNKQYMKLRDKRSQNGEGLRYIIFKISKDRKKIVVHKASESTNYDDFIKDAQDSECFFAVYDLEYSEGEMEGMRRKICFFQCIPDMVRNTGDKFLYALSKNNLKDCLPGLKAEIQVNDISDLDFKNVKNRVSRN